MVAAVQKKHFYNDLFDAIIDLLDSRQIIDDAPTTEDIFIDDNYSAMKRLRMTVNKLLTTF